MKRYVSGILLGYALILIGCEDVFEEDISDGDISIISPVDGETLEGNTVQFRWNDLDGADAYRVQISGQGQIIELDSLVDSNLFQLQMSPGSYNWRVRGENFAYATPFNAGSSFTLNALDDLSGQTVGLSTPNNNSYLNNKNTSFGWNGISTADAYHFRLFKKETSAETLVFEDDKVLGTSFTLPENTITEDAEYIWQVSANNDTSNTSFSERTFFLDTQNPPVPTLGTPSENQNLNVNEPVNFSWSFADTGDVQSDLTAILEISSDENFSTIDITDSNATGEFSHTFTVTGNYYWRVRGMDEAGNSGENSAVRSIIID